MAASQGRKAARGRRSRGAPDNDAASPAEAEAEPAPTPAPAPRPATAPALGEDPFAKRAREREQEQQRRAARASERASERARLSPGALPRRALPALAGSPARVRSPRSRQVDSDFAESEEEEEDDEDLYFALHATDPRACACRADADALVAECAEAPEPPKRPKDRAAEMRQAFVTGTPHLKQPLNEEQQAEYDAGRCAPRVSMGTPGGAHSHHLVLGEPGSAQAPANTIKRRGVVGHYLHVVIRRAFDVVVEGSTGLG